MATETPAVIIPINLGNGVTLETTQRTRTGKGDRKGEPYLVPLFGADRAVFPKPEQFAQILAVLGQEPMLKAITTEVVGPVFKAASAAALVKDANGALVIDATKLAGAVKAAVAEYSATARKVDELRGRKEEVTRELGAIMQEVLSASGSGKPIPQDIQNRAKRLLVEQGEIEAEINKRVGAGKKAPAADTGAKKA